MHKLTALLFQSWLVTQESSESMKESVETLNPVTATHSLESEQRRVIQIAKALARPYLYLWILFLVYTFIIPTIGLLASQKHVNHVYNGTILFVIGGAAAGFTLTQTERPFLLAGVMSREVWRVTIVFAWAAATLIAISMGCCAVLDITPGGVGVTDVYMIKHAGVDPYLQFPVPVGAFPGATASVRTSIANRYLSSGGTATVVVPTILFMNPISYLIILHALRSGLFGYVSYLLVASAVYPLLLRFILDRPRSEEWATQGGTRGAPMHRGSAPVIRHLSYSLGDSTQYRESQGGASLGP